MYVKIFFICFVDLELMFLFWLSFCFEVRIWNISVKDEWMMDEVWWTERGGIAYLDWVGSPCRTGENWIEVWHASIRPFIGIPDSLH